MQLTISPILDVFVFIIWEDDKFHLFQVPLSCHDLRTLQDTKSVKMN